MSQSRPPSSVTAIVLAAGQGKRMKSKLPKVLHHLCGRPMIDWVVEAALEAGAADAVVVVGHGREAVEDHLAVRFGSRVRIAVQEEQNGTGHAVRCALPVLRADAHEALVLYGDTPLVRPSDLGRLARLRLSEGAALALLTCQVNDPTGYGRILRDGEGRIRAVREHRDASDEERAIREVNPGMYAARLDFLKKAVAELDSDNDQGELYLTDVVEVAATSDKVISLRADPLSLTGINDRAQLARAEDVLYHRIADGLRREGATIRAGARIDAEVRVERDAVVDHGAVLRGRTVIGKGARVDVGCVLEDVEVADGAWLKPYSVCSGAQIGQLAQIGPFAHLRPETRVDAEARVGNFVETKKTHLRRGAKANHLAYLGDGEIGEGANVGAGTIFCNYDGFRKHRTVIEAGAFIGSDSQIVAPVTIGRGSYVATGTTVTQDVPADALAIARVRQTNKEGYAPRLRARLAANAKAPAKGDDGD